MSTRASLVACALATFGFLLAALAFYPGVFTFDSLDQFAQARSGAFTDWHPPAMAALWFVLDKLHEGPELLFFTHLALLWAGLAAIGAALALSGAPRLGACFPLIGLLPFVFNYEGVLWKDVALASAWICAAGLAFAQRARQRPLPRWLFAFLVALFVYGALVRSNSIFAAAPLGFYLLGGRILRGAPLRQIAALAAIPIALVVTGAMLNRVILHVEPQHPEASLMLFDIAGVSHEAHVELLPGEWPPGERTRLLACYRPQAWDYMGMGHCAGLPERLGDQDLWGGRELASTWLAAVTGHPLAYILHRAAFTNAIMRWRGPYVARDFAESEMTDLRWRHVPNAVSVWYRTMVGTLEATPLFRPYFWFLASLAVAALATLATDSPAARFAGALGASGGLYLATYAVFGVAPDFRYAYWSILATLAGAAALGACTWPRPRRALAVLGAAGAVLAIAIVGSAF